MKKVIRNIVSVLFLAFAIVMVYPQSAQAAVKLNKTSATLFVGESVQLSVSGTSKKVTWKSGNTKVATVSSKGKVVAKKSGNATITATVSGKSYKCNLKVNSSFKLNAKSVSIKNTKVLNAYLSANGGVKYYPANPKTCTITFGKWNGDYLPITIEPKKVGTETIRFTNTANKEEWQLTIKVTALPVKASFEDPVISSGANYLIVDSNTVSFTFKTNRKAKDVEFRVYDDNGKVVRKINIGALAAKKETTVKWNGLNSSGKPVNSVCTYAVLADGTKTIGGSIKVLPTSPFGQGEGTENNPFMVSNVDEFLMMKDYSGDCFVQDADIDFKYMPVSSLFDELIPFSGSFSGKNNGKSYQMMNLMGYQSLFGTIAKTGVVRDLTMTNCVINSFGSFLAYTNYGTIENCSVTGNILCNSGQQAAMIAIVNKGQIHDCKVSGKMSVNATDVTDSTTLKAGGIVVQNEGIIAQCVSSVKMSQMLEVGQLVSSNKYKVQCGGIAVENAAEAFIVTCTFDGKIETKVKMEDLLSPNYEILSGGIAAENKIGSYITQCTFNGAIETKEIAWDVPVNTLLTSENLYIGYVAGRNDAYISTCVNASSNKELAVFGTGTGMVQ